MSRKGACLSCGEMRWLGAKGQTCKPCAYPLGPCVQCEHFGKIYVDGLCYCCYQHRQVENKLTDLARGFKAKTAYNHDLFLFYLAYIRRYRLSYFHLRQAAKLSHILQTDVWPTITSWNEVHKLSLRYCLKHPNGKASGCAVVKIALMLVELGILQPKQEDYSTRIAQKIAAFPRHLQDDITDLVAWLNKSNRRPATAYKNLCHLESYVGWVASVYPGLSPFNVHESKIIEYLQYLEKIEQKPSHRNDILMTLRRFFARLCYRKKLFSNPCEQIGIAKLHVKINIVSQADLKGLMAYIKNTSSPPEEALALVLILFFAFKTEDLLRATIASDSNEDFTIIIAQTSRSHGRHYYHREQILKLPNNPDWLRKLKVRFLQHWREAYQKTKQTYPTQRLILPRHYHHTRPLHESTLVERIYAATIVATGKKISPKILRQTCGHLHTRNGDGSLLATLGWSPSFAFQYTWLPRRIV